MWTIGHVSVTDYRSPSPPVDEARGGEGRDLVAYAGGRVVQDRLHLLPAAEMAVAEALGRAAVVTDRMLAPLDAPERQRLVALLQRFVTGG